MPDSVVVVVVVIVVVVVVVVELTRRSPYVAGRVGRIRRPG